MKQSKVHYAWWILLSCCAIAFVGIGLVWNTAGLFYTPVCKDLGFTRAQISLMSTIQSLACVVAFPYSGKIFRKKDVRLTLSVSFAVICVAEICASLFHNLISFYIMGAITGLAQPIAVALSSSTLLNNWFSKKVGTAIGISTATSGIGGMIFSPIVTKIITESGWRAAYRFIGIVGLIIILPFTLFVVRSKPADKGLLAYGQDTDAKTDKKDISQSGLTLKEARKTKEYVLIIIALMAVSMVAGVTQHVSSHVVNVGFTLEDGGLVVSALMFGAAVGKLTLGGLFDKVKPTIAMLIFAVFGFLGWSGLSLHVSKTELIASGFLIGLAQAILFVAFPYYLRKIFGLKEYVSIYASISIFGSLSVAAMTYITGWVFDLTKSYTLILLINACLFILAYLCLTTALHLSVKRGEKENEPAKE